MYESCIIDRLFVVRWRDAEPNDFETIVAALEDQHFSRREPLLFLAVMPADVPVPSMQVLQALNAVWERFFRHTEHAMCAIEGNTPRAILQRSVNRTLILLSGHRERASVHSSVKDALRYVSASLKTDPGRVLRHLELQGFIEPQLEPAIS